MELNDVNTSDTGSAVASDRSVSVSGTVNGNITIMADRAGLAGQVLIVALLVMAAGQRWFAGEDLGDLLDAGMVVAVLAPVVIVASYLGNRGTRPAARTASFATAFVAVTVEAVLLVVLGGLPDPSDEGDTRARDEGSASSMPTSSEGVTTTGGSGGSRNTDGGSSNQSPVDIDGGHTPSSGDNPVPTGGTDNGNTPSPTLATGELRNSGILVLESGQAANLDSSERGDWQVGLNDRDWKSVGYNVSYDGTTVGFDGSSGSFAMMGTGGGWTYNSCRQAPYGNSSATGSAIDPGHGICYLTTKGHQALLVVQERSADSIRFMAQVWQG